MAVFTQTDCTLFAELRAMTALGLTVILPMAVAGAHVPVVVTV